MGQVPSQDNSKDLAATLSGYAKRWYRPGHADRPIGPLLDAQFSDCVTMWQAFNWGSVIPRRLGGQASPRELATDKKAMRRLTYLYELRAWQWADLIPGATVDENRITQEARRLGAQVQVPRWVHSRIDSIEDWGSELATAALRTGDSRLANQVVARIESELHGLERVQALYVTT